MNYEFRTLTTDADLLRFKQEYESGLRERSRSKLHVVVSVEYLRTSRVVGCFSRRDGRLVAGFVIRDAPPFRAFEAIPEAERAANAFVSGVAADELCELTCIWRNDGISSTHTALRVWPRIIRDCVLNGRRYILGIGFDNKMNDVYGRVGPLRIYDGPAASRELATDVHIYAFTRPRIAANFATNFFLKMIARPAGALRRRQPRPAPGLER